MVPSYPKEARVLTEVLSKRYLSGPFFWCFHVYANTNNEEYNTSLMIFSNASYVISCIFYFVKNIHNNVVIKEDFMILFHAINNTQTASQENDDMMHLGPPRISSVCLLVLPYLGKIHRRTENTLTGLDLRANHKYFEWKI